jgi:hypothetical protein
MTRRKTRQLQPKRRGTESRLSLGQHSLMIMTTLGMELVCPQQDNDICYLRIGLGSMEFRAHMHISIDGVY